MDAWVEHELAALHVGDVRLDARVRDVVTRLAARPTASVPVALGEPAAIKATYRLCANPRVHPASILAAWRKATRARALTAGWVLLVQDTTSLDFTAHTALAGVGMLDHPSSRGVFVHTTLAVSVDGIPLGVVAQELWTRDPATRGIGTQRNSRPTAAKESQRWLTALAASQQALWGPITTVTITDREGEMYDLWTAPRRPTDHLLLRMKHDRATVAPAAGPHLRAALQQAPVAATLTLTVPRQHTGGPTQRERTATVQVQYASVTLAVPQLKTGEPLQVQGILVTEVDAPAGITAPIEWVLLTTLPVPSPEVALLYVEWYTYRWRIERFHYVLKSGCGIERTQVRTVTRLARVLALYSLVAWRLLSLLYAAREAPDVVCTTVLTPTEWQMAWVTTHPATAPPPATPPSVQAAVRLIARLGGFRGRVSDGEPGIQSLWRGWARLMDMLEGYQTIQRLAMRDVGTA